MWRRILWNVKLLVTGKSAFSLHPPNCWAINERCFSSLLPLEEFDAAFFIRLIYTPSVGGRRTTVLSPVYRSFALERFLQDKSGMQNTVRGIHSFGDKIKVTEESRIWIMNYFLFFRNWTKFKCVSGVVNCDLVSMAGVMIISSGRQSPPDDIYHLLSTDDGDYCSHRGIFLMC